MHETLLKRFVNGVWGHRFAALFILLQFLFRLWILPNIPAEIFNDVVENLRMTREIVAQGVDMNRWLGGADGPLLAHLAVLPTRIFGETYSSLKFVTAVCSSIIMLCTYTITHVISRRKLIAFVALWIVSFSFWNLSQSVSAKPHMISATVAALVGCMFVLRKHVWVGVLAGIGMYSQVSFWPMALLALLHPVSMVTYALSSLHFVYYFITNRATLLSGSSYTGEKFAIASTLSLFEKSSLILNNLFIQIRALFTQGDTTFRHNVPGQAHLDPITASLFVVGMVVVVATLLRRKNIQAQKRILLGGVVLPLLLTQLLAAFDIANPAAVPNIGRTSGMMSFIAVVCALGIGAFLSHFPNRYRRVSQGIFLTIILGVSGLINLHRFLILYPQTLPNNNVSFTTEIVRAFSRYAPDTRKLVVGCCWGEWGQPEDGAFHNLGMRKEIDHVSMDVLVKACSSKAVARQKIVVAMPPDTDLQKIVACTQSAPTRSLIVRGEAVADIVEYSAPAW